MSEVNDYWEKRKEYEEEKRSEYTSTNRRIELLQKIKELEDKHQSETADYFSIY